MKTIDETGNMAKLDARGIVEDMAAEGKKMRLEEGYIVLSYAGYDYDIELVRADSPGKILGWMEQLAQKNWMTAARLERFAALAFQQIGVKRQRGM